MKTKIKLFLSIIIFVSLSTVVFAQATATTKKWTEVESLKKAYVDSGIFDHIGLAVSRDEIYNCKVANWNETSYKTNPEIAAGLEHHVNSITLGNEFKPQWFLWHYNGVPAHTKDFTASNGVTIKVPTSIPSTNDTAHGFGGVDTCLQYCKDHNLQMRGHVLTWHSQTFDWFFCKDYDTSKGLLPSTPEGKAEMTARHEWYIKTVLEHIADWEKKNNGGKHIIYSWDVVNEAVADDASRTVYVRGATNGTKNPVPLNNGCNSQGDSRWYQIYQSDEFIINAFRFANKYAPKDVTLCYNDYNEYMDYGGDGPTHKRTGIINLLKSIMAHTNDKTLPARIDAVGMQSHVENWVSLSGYEQTIKEFLALGLDIQITEFDIKYNDATKNNNFNKPLADIYESYFKLFKKYAKSTRGKNGITSVTIWGIEDGKTWLNYPGNTFYPLLFTRDKSKNIVAKDALISVINAAKN